MEITQKTTPAARHKKSCTPNFISIMLVFGAGFSMPRVTAAADNSSAVVVAEIMVGTNKHSIFCTP